MRLAYADPPYPGQAKRWYEDHPDYGGEVDHAQLVERLESYDGWALHTSASDSNRCSPSARMASGSVSGTNQMRCHPFHRQIGGGRGNR